MDPASILQDVIRDNGLGEVELFDGTSLSSGLLGGHHLSSHISAMRWRPECEDDFVVAPSTSTGKAHLYIQKVMTSTDHNALIEEMYNIGAIDRGWRKIVNDSKGGVLRTPWTEKSQFHRVS